MNATDLPRAGYARPKLTPRRALFWAVVAVFAIWVALLTWMYVSQVVMKKA